MHPLVKQVPRNSSKPLDRTHLEPQKFDGQLLMSQIASSRCSLTDAAHSCRAHCLRGRRATSGPS